MTIPYSNLIGQVEHTLFNVFVREAIATENTNTINNTKYSLMKQIKKSLVTQVHLVNGT